MNDDRDREQPSIPLAPIQASPLPPDATDDPAQELLDKIRTALQPSASGIDEAVNIKVHAGIGGVVVQFSRAIDRLVLVTEKARVLARVIREQCDASDVQSETSAKARAERRKQKQKRRRR
jgi:hypothetical protein